jgi:hypothetical protein
LSSHFPLGPFRVANGGWLSPGGAQPRPKGLTAAQVELTLSSVQAGVKQENTTYGVGLLKTPIDCTRVAAKCAILPGEAGKWQAPDKRKRASFTAETWSGVILSSSEGHCQAGKTARAENSLARLQGESKRIGQEELPLQGRRLPTERQGREAGRPCGRPPGDARARGIVASWPARPRS